VKSIRRTAAVVRFFLISLLVVLVGSITRFVFHRPERPPVIRSETKPLSEQKVDIKENIRYVLDSGGKNIIEVEAPRNFTDVKGMSHLLGREDLPESRAKMVSRHRNGDIEFQISAKEIIYNSEKTRFFLRGDVVIRIEGAAVKGPSFDYDRESTIIISNSPVAFEGERFQAESRQVRYDVGAESLYFFQGVTLVASPSPEDPIPMIFDGDTLDYNLKARAGKIKENVKITHGRSRGRADLVDFVQSAEKKGFRLVEFSGGVVMDVEEQPSAKIPVEKTTRPDATPNASTDEDLIFFQGGRQHLEAGLMTFLPEGDSDWFHSVTLGKRGSLEIFNETGQKTTLSAGSLTFFYNRNGTLRDFNLRDQVVILGEADGRTRLVEGPKIDFNAHSQMMIAIGEGEKRARTVFRGREVTADSIKIFFQSNDFEIEGRVKIVSTPQPGEKRETAFFNSERQVFMTADSSTLTSSLHRFRLNGRARLWQDRDTLEAGEVAVFEDTGNITATGDVRSVFFHRPQGKDRDERVQVAGENLTRNSSTGQILYMGECSMSVANIRLKAGRLNLEPAKEAGKFSRIIADTGRVIITLGLREAEGDQADYDLDKGLIELTGRPVLREKGKGEVKGDKLTFYTADGRIRIENRDSERSITIIKS